MNELDVLTEQYCQVHRKYHTLGHIGYMFTLARSFVSLSSEQSAAIWWHDAVYYPFRDDNEERSVDLFRRVVTMPELSKGIVSKMIMATKTHVPNDYDEAVVCDLDMAILGAETGDYTDYAVKLHTEYSPYFSSSQYVDGRIAFLRKQLDKPNIFFTEHFAHLESKAKENIARELRLWEIKK